MYASVLKAAGLHAMIFLVPGHAFPGVLVNNRYYAIEATGIGGQGLGNGHIMTPEEALAAGDTEIKNFVTGLDQGDTRNIVIDVNNLEAAGVVPMELPDDDFLRKKVDDIAATFSGGGATSAPFPTATARTPVRRPAPARRSNGGNTNNDNGNSGSGTYSGVISFNYPTNWGRKNYPLANVNTLVSVVYSGDQTQASVWNVQASSTDQALYIVKQQLAALGQTITYQRTNYANGYTKYEGMSYYKGTSQRWEGIFRSGGDGIVGVTMSSPNYFGNTNLFNSIIRTIH
jgi:hypothetical protein